MVRPVAHLAALALAFILATGGMLAPTSVEPVAAGGPKVAIIVGPVAGLTSNYRNRADQVAAVATAAGATVAKAYSPNATWANVRAAVNNANVIVYFGHGNGYPNPYTIGTEYTDRVNGWGLNRTTSNGDSDGWNSTMVYCGEKALLGTLTSADGAAQRQYCGYPNNDGISPAPGFVMVYGQAHYAPGFGERYNESDPVTTLSEAQQRVRNYSTPILALGGTFFATAYGDAHEIVQRVLTQPDAPYGEIFAQGDGYSPSTLTESSHPDFSGKQYWVQRTVIANFHFGDPDYWYAFAGDPARTPSGDTGPFNDIYGSVFYDDIIWLYESSITGGCGSGRFCPNTSVTRAQMASFLVRALDLPPASQDYFWDDGASAHEPDINAVAEAGITGGCGDGRYCPGQAVTRAEMATFLSRALSIPESATDAFWDDDGSMHEPNINAVASASIAGGCGSGKYCPASSVTRGQMAAFLHRALD
ncbi:MAG TPA: S-layer homology domain-containing protein [Candidatus Limnocylindria bacterium]|nr:S-layer homology domain-containing protein [Candidatus Limnocylindria bacterium]